MKPPQPGQASRPGGVQADCSLHAWLLCPIIGAAFGARMESVMAKLRFSTFSIVLLAALQTGCATMPDRAAPLRSSVDVPRPTCDTSIRYIDLAARIPNNTNGDIEFNLVGDRGPRFDLWYMGYRVYSSAPGQPFRLVHDSGQDSAWTRKVAIAPGNSAEFKVPLFGLRRDDYFHYFRIELRDSKGRPYWTPVFELCSVARASCGCRRVGASSASSQAPRQACAAAPLASVADDATQIEVGVDCR